MSHVTDLAGKRLRELYRDAKAVELAVQSRFFASEEFKNRAPYDPMVDPVLGPLEAEYEAAVMESGYFDKKRRIIARQKRGMRDKCWPPRFEVAEVRQKVAA